MTFPNIVFYCFLMLALLALATLWRWLLRLMGQLDIAPEKRVLFTITVVALAAFLAITLGARLNSWRHSSHPPIPVAGAPAPTTSQPPQISIRNNQATNPAPTPETISLPCKTKGKTTQIKIIAALSDAKQLTEFTKACYPELFEHLTALYGDIQQLEQFAQKVIRLKQSNPKQQGLLDGILNSRYASYQQLTRKNDEVTLQLQNFWAHYKTGNAHDAMDKFAPVSVRLTNAIKDVRGEQPALQNKETRLVSEAMRGAGTALKNNKLPDRNQGLRPYTPANRQLLMDWLDKQDSIGLLGQLGQLVEQRAKIGLHIQQVNRYLQLYPHLQNSLLQTRQRWEEARLDNFYAEYRLLNSLELEYILDRLELANTVTASVKRLDTERDAALPKIINYVQDSLTKAEESYNPTALK